MSPFDDVIMITESRDPWSTSIRYRSDSFTSDRYPIGVDPSVLAIWAGIHVCHIIDEKGWKMQIYPVFPIKNSTSKGHSSTTSGLHPNNIHGVHTTLRVMWWQNQWPVMTSWNGNFSTLLALYEGIPHKGQWRGASMFSLVCSWINCWTNSRKVGELIYLGAHLSSPWCDHWDTWRVTPHSSRLQTLRWSLLDYNKNWTELIDHIMSERAVSGTNVRQKAIT